MAKKKTANVATKARTGKGHPGTGHTCGECRIGTWLDNFINKDTAGKPIVKKCDFSTYARNVRGERVCQRTTPACEMFEGDEE